ncbi:MAG TPA: riboflavin synthase, partial [Bacteroidales bacterium]|nr:riboflavin synthase [Bacteroidales bacterium]
MFSGIVEETAKVVNIVQEQSNFHFYLTCSFAHTLKPDQSVSHNGVCLTVVEVDTAGKTYKVTAIQETLDKSNLGLLKIGDEVNVERSMTMDKLLDGHMVQGHVDQTAECIELTEADGSWYYT